eukprot:7174582-Pyramimonas_sp.AAC.1
MDLFRFICHTKCTSHCRMSTWVGDRMEDVLLNQYSDADLASDIRTHRARVPVIKQSGAHALELGGLWGLSGR